MAALKFCQSQLTGDPLVCWELVSGVISAGALTGTSVCVRFRGEEEVGLGRGRDRGEVFVLRFTPQLWITWQGKRLSHSMDLGGRGSQPFWLHGSQDKFRRKWLLLPWYGQCPFRYVHYFPTITPESHSTSLVFTVPPWFCGKQVLLLLYKMFVPLWGGRVLACKTTFLTGKEKAIKTHNVGDRTLR